MAAASRFVEILKEFLDILLDNSVPKKTKKATKYVQDEDILWGIFLFLLDKTTNFFRNSRQIQDKSSFTFLRY